MGDEITKSPNIRFTGFTDAWEQRKLDEVMKDFIVPMRDKPKEFGGTIPWTRIEDIEGKYINGSLSEQYVTNETITKMNLKIIPKNSLIVSASATFGVVAVVTRDLITNQTFIGLVPNEEYDLNYLHTFFQSPFARKYMKEKSAGSTIFYISKNDFKNMIALHPSFEEQKKIGEYFNNLDKLITLHESKLELLKVTKRSMLKKMFPKDGENLPEIRFSGFSDAWEQRELNKYIETSKDKNSNGIYTKSDVLSVSGEVGIVNQIEYQGRSFAGVSVKNYGVVDIGNIVYTKSPLKINPHGIIKTNKGKPGIVSTLYAVYKAKENTNPNFVHCYFESDYRLNKYLKPLVNKGAKNDMKVSDDNALLGLVMFPYYDEQTKISQFFEAMDILITLHQKELDLLKDLKKSKLKQMFI